MQPGSKGLGGVGCASSAAPAQSGKRVPDEKILHVVQKLAPISRRPRRLRIVGAVIADVGQGRRASVKTYRWLTNPSNSGLRRH